MPAMEPTKQVFYSPPLALLPKRKDCAVSTTATSYYHHHHHHPQGPALTVTVPFAFSARLSRLDARRLSSATSIRRCRAAPATTPRTTSLPRLAQSSARPSHTTSRSTVTPPGSAVKKTSSGCGGSLESEADEADLVDHVAVDGEEQEALSPEEEAGRRLNNEKCQRWLEGLPERFSSMHVVQHIVHNPNRQTVDDRSMFLS